MKKISYKVAAIAIYIVSFSAFAGNINPPTVAPVNAAETSTHIGVIDMRTISERSVQIAQMRDKLQKEFKPKQDKFIASQKTLKDDADRLRRDNAIMNNKDRKQLEQKILEEQQELQRMEANLQQEFLVARNKEMKSFLDNINKVIEKTAKSENLNLVIYKDAAPFFTPNLDITNKVMQQIPHK